MRYGVLSAGQTEIIRPKGDTGAGRAKFRRVDLVGRFERGRVPVVQGDSIVTGFDLDADVPKQRFALMLPHSEDVVDTGENRRKDGFAVRRAFCGGSAVG